MADTIAVVAKTYGGPEVLEIVSTPVPAPLADEVVVEVRAAGINPIDWKLYGGARGTDPTAMPMRMGLEASGVIVAVGEDTQGPAGPISVGDEVMVFPARGAYAERIVVPASSVIPRPSELTWEQAAGLLLAGCTAVHALTAVDPSEGEVLLVHAASGAVGRLATELAVGRGSRVIGTASPDHHDSLRELGATPVAYGDGLEQRILELAPDGVDAAIDAVGTAEAIAVSLRLVRDRNRIVSVVAEKPARDAGVRLLGGAPGADPGTEIRNAARLELAQIAANGGLRLPVASYPLDEVAAAHRLGQSGHPGAKLVLLAPTAADGG
jgi:NADPH:quinone reductase